MAHRSTTCHSCSSKCTEQTRLGASGTSPRGGLPLAAKMSGWPQVRTPKRTTRTTPIPLVNKRNSWYFDTEAGKRGILYRRIGRNEISTTRVCQELVAAERSTTSYATNTLRRLSAMKNCTMAFIGRLRMANPTFPPFTYVKYISVSISSVADRDGGHLLSMIA